MKKTGFFVACCFLLIPPTMAFAQTHTKTFPSSALQAYEEWKRNELGEKADATKHYALAVVSKRTGSGSAKLDVAVIGEMANGFMLEVQPVIIPEEAANQSAEEVGRVTSTSVTTASLNADLASPATLTVILPVTSTANALKIKWLFSQRVKGESGGETLSPRILEMWVWLGDAPESAVAAVMKAPVK